MSAFSNQLKRYGQIDSREVEILTTAHLPTAGLMAEC